jgi:hypothetical protein
MPIFYDGLSKIFMSQSLVYWYGSRYYLFGFTILLKPF